MISNKKQYILNLVSGYGGTIVNTLIAFFSVPIALNYWGVEQYGIWTIITSFASYIAISGLGIDAAANILMTKNPDYRIKKSILLKSILLLLIIAILLLLIFFIVIFLVDDWYKIIGKYDIQYDTIVKKTLFVFIIGLIINMPLSACSSALNSIGKSYLNNTFAIITSIIGFSIILLTRIFCLSLDQYVFLYLLNLISFSFIKLFILFYYLRNNIKVSIETEKNEENSFKFIFSTGINLSLFSLPSLLIPNISNLIISNFIGMEALVPYSIIYKLFTTAFTFLLNINVSASPILGAEFGKKNFHYLKNKLQTLFYITIFVSFFIAYGVILFSKPFIYLWTGSIKNFPGFGISLALSIYFIGYGFNNFNQVQINSFNFVKNNWIFSWVESLFVIFISYFLIKFFGVIGIPLSLGISFWGVTGWCLPKVIIKKSYSQLNSYNIGFMIREFFVYFAFAFSGYFIQRFILNLFYYTLISFFIFIGYVVISFLLLPKDFRDIILLKGMKMRRYNNE